MENVKTITLNIEAITDDLDNELLGKTFKSIVSELRKQDILVDDCRVELLLSKINAKEVKKNTTEIIVNINLKTITKEAVLFLSLLSSSLFEIALTAVTTKPKSINKA